MNVRHGEILKEFEATGRYIIGGRCLTLKPPKISFWVEKLPKNLESFYYGHEDLYEFEKQFWNIKKGIWDLTLHVLSDDAIHVIDSSMVSCLVFVEHSINSGICGSKTLEQLRELKTEITKTLEANKPDQYIWMYTPPMTCLDRIARRGRPGEEEVTLENLQALEKIYDSIVLKDQFITNHYFQGNPDAELINLYSLSSGGWPSVCYKKRTEKTIIIK